jgi:hypothetical protein
MREEKKAASTSMKRRALFFMATHGMDRGLQALSDCRNTVQRNERLP